MTSAEIHHDPDAVPSTARGVLTVDLGAIAANWRWLAALSGPAECAGVLKADAYGLGLEPVAKALDGAGCRTFFVATTGEAGRLKAALPAAMVYIFDGLMPGTAHEIARIGAIPVLGSRAEVEEWVAYCRSVETRLPAALHLDTGMSRLGVPPGEVEELGRDRDLFQAFDLRLVISHLACADTPGHPTSDAQRLLFDQLRRALPPARASLANSAGIMLGSAFRYDLVRPGIALYGGRAVAGRPNPAAKVVRLEARILQVRDLPAGTAVGYGSAFVTDRSSRIATIATGYADGFLRSISGPIGLPSPPATIAGHSAPIVGRVSMDVITLDVTDVPAEFVHRGAFAELIGRHVLIDDLADSSGTIGYEVLTRLGDRYHRMYVGGGEKRTAG